MSALGYPDYNWFSGRGQDLDFITRDASMARRWNQVILAAAPGHNPNTRSGMAYQLDFMLSGMGFPTVLGQYYLPTRERDVELKAARETLQIVIRVKEARLHCLEMLCISSGA